MIVIVCPSCGFGRIVDSDVSKARCAHCGKSITVAKAVRHYDGEDAVAARTALFIINAGMRPQTVPPRIAERVARSDARSPVRESIAHERRSVDTFLTSRDCFVVAELQEYLGIGKEEAEGKVARMVEAGKVYSPARGTYCVVR